MFKRTAFYQMLLKEVKVKSVIDWIVDILVVVGAINWGLVGLFQWNLVEFISFGQAWLATTLYVLVGLSGLWMLYKLFK